MKRRILNFTLITLNILVIVLFVVQYTSATYPMVGHDYRLFVPRLIDSHLYYKINGFSIEWYTPYFGGGLPAYPNPLQMQFSVPQLLTWFINPWIAILASTALYIAIGFIVAFLFLRDILELKPLSAILGAGFFLANGFFIERVVIGHVNFITFPLIVIPIFALLNPKLPRWLAGVLVSVTGAAMVYSGGVYIAVIGLFSALIIIPTVYFLKPNLLSWRKMLPVLLWSGILTAFLCGSKLYATAAYMRNFPRTVHDSYNVNWITGLVGMIFQLAGTMNVYTPLHLLGKSSLSFVVHLNQWTGTPYSFWELDSSLTPGAFLLLGIGSWIILFHKPKIENKEVILKKAIAGVCLLFAIILATEFSIAKGILYEQLSKLPILQSLHADTRFTSSFVLPLAFIAAKIFDVWAGKWKSGTKTFIAFIMICGISLASMWSYYFMPTDVQARFFDIGSMTETYQRIATGEIQPVDRIVPDMNDYEVFILHSSNISHHYDPLFRDNNELLTPFLHEGPVLDVENGYYNMTDPTSLVFPQTSNSYLFERIPVSDYNKMVDFLNHRQVDWKLPLLQIILDWAAGLTFVLIICVIVFYLARERIPRLKSLRFPPFPRLNRP